jgi:hypothetical protein
VACLLLPAASFDPVGYPAVWRKLTTALQGTSVMSAEPGSPGAATAG